MWDSFLHVLCSHLHVISCYNNLVEMLRWRWSLFCSLDIFSHNWYIPASHTADSRLAPSQWETLLRSKAVSDYWEQTQNQSCHSTLHVTPTLIARFIGPTWGPSGADRAQVGPMLASWSLLSGYLPPTCDAKQRKTAMCSINHALCIVFRN